MAIFFPFEPGSIQGFVPAACNMAQLCLRHRHFQGVLVSWKARLTPSGSPGPNAIPFGWQVGKTWL